MKNQQEIKCQLFFERKTPENALNKKIASTKIFIILLIVFSSVLTLAASCKEEKHGYSSKTEASAKSQGTARVSREKVIEYLQESNLIEDPMNYKIEFTNEHLYIDGQQQPENIHLHIIRNFVENPDGHLEVTYEVSTD